MSVRQCSSALTILRASSAARAGMRWGCMLVHCRDPGPLIALPRAAAAPRLLAAALLRHAPW